MSIETYLSLQKEKVNSYLDNYLPGEDEVPEIIHRSIRYSVFSGGKRFRAALCMASCESLGGNVEKVLPVACGIELIHTYSLIHDDLPCMDDDDLRRGKPTLHKVFGENMAVLAGDALNALAFDLVSRAEDCGLIRVLADAIGTKGMIGGQVADVLSNAKDGISGQTVEFIHRRKTGALIRASIEMGAMTAGGDEETIHSMSEFGARVGLAFQIVDDILDIVSSDEVLGKTVGSDEEKDKATYPKVFGLEKSKEIARELSKQAIGILDEIEGRDISVLKGLSDFVVKRVY